MRQFVDRTLWRLILGLMLALLAIVAYWPSPVDEPVQGTLAGFLDSLHRHGMPSWFNYKFVEASANVALFVPLGLASTLAFPEKRWWHIAGLGLLISGCMEMGQFLFLHNRFASVSDLVTNTAGAVIGALLATATPVRVWPPRPAADTSAGPADGSSGVSRGP